MKKVPILIELQGLDFKYWGENCLKKIVSPIGQFLRLDQTTMNRETLISARMLVVVDVNQEFPSMVKFRNEKGCIVNQPVYHPWKPIQCMKCNGFGHSQLDCVTQKKKLNRLRSCG